MNFYRQARLKFYLLELLSQFNELIKQKGNN